MIKFGFEISTMTSEEQLRNDAECIAIGYWWPQLGKRQKQMLRRMLDGGPGYYGVNYEDRRVLAALKRRELASSTPPEPGSQAWWAGANRWNLTELGRHVAEVLAKTLSEAS